MLTYEYLLKLISMLTYNPPSHIPVIPKNIALALAHAMQCIWWSVLSPDEVEHCYIDDIDTPGNWAVVGVEPNEIENHTQPFNECGPLCPQLLLRKPTPDTPSMTMLSSPTAATSTLLATSKPPPSILIFYGPLLSAPLHVTMSPSPSTRMSVPACHLLKPVCKSLQPLPLYQTSQKTRRTTPSMSNGQSHFTPTLKVV